MSERTYTLICHGCGRLHEKRASFLSSPLAFRVGDWTIPMSSCGECPREAIANAYHNGMTPEARARATREGEAWIARKAVASEGGR